MDTWETPAQIAAARERLERAIDGWVPPVLHGVGLVPSGAEVSAEHFRLVNGQDHRLPGVVVATVVGHRAGTAAYALTRADLERAVELLAPAEACTEFEHPNLWTWRDAYLPALARDPTAALVAVFLGPSPSTATDPAIDAFRGAARRAGRLD